MGKVKKKVNLGVLGVDSQDSKGVPQSCLDPTTFSPRKLVTFGFLGEMLDFLGVFKGIKFKIKKWKYTNQLPISCSNSSHLAFAMGKFLNVCTHWCSNALQTPRYQIVVVSNYILHLPSQGKSCAIQFYLPMPIRLN